MSWSLLLMIVSIAIADLPVWRSPMISSRLPRPIGIMPSIAFSPVCRVSLTGWRWTTPGALNSAGRVASVSISPLPSSGLPSGSTMRPSRPSPTGISSSLPERLTVSPSSILSHSPHSTTPTLSDSRFSARPVTSCGSSSISSDWQLSSPCTRAMPSAIDSTVPTSERSAPPSSSPSILCLRMLVISSGLIFMSAMSPWIPPKRCCRAARLVVVSSSLSARQLSGLGHLLPKSLQAGADRPVHDLVPDPQHEAAEQVRVDLGRELDLAVRLVLDLLADVLHEVLVELDRARDRHREQLALLGVEVVEVPLDAEDRRHAVALREELEEAHEVLVRPADHLADALLLLLRGEVRREEVHLEVAVLVERLDELPELVVHVVEHVVLVGDVEQRARVDLGDLFHLSCGPRRRCRCPTRRARRSSGRAPRSRTPTAPPRSAGGGPRRRATCA